MSKILLLGSQHGDELLGEQLYAYIIKNNPEISQFITYLVGNLRAYQKKVRYIESDLNRSYNGGTSTYEERRATRILNYIKKNNFDLVLDLHTTTCLQPPCFIIANITDDNCRFLRSSSIDIIIRMKPAIIASSLIGSYSKAVSIEVSKSLINSCTLMNITKDIKRYIENVSTRDTTKNIYEISDFLQKGELSDEDIAKLRNFEYSPHGFYPILVGEESYKKQSEYLGFKACKLYKNKV